MSWINKVQNRLPNLRAKLFYFTHGNILINDLRLEHASDLMRCVKFNVPIDIFEAAELTVDLKSMIDLTSFDHLVFPGNGAAIVERHLGNCPNGFHVDAKREGYKNPKPRVDQFSLQDGSVAVIDDVISSGETAFEVYRVGLRCPATLCAWIIQYPRDAKLGVYESIIAPLCVGGEKGKVPVNSLSTLCSDAEIAKSYAERFCAHGKDFFAAIDLLREEVHS